MLDKLHEECGVVAIYGHPEASNLTYLALYALQHRGQESAGIASSGGGEIHCYKAMGHIAEIFTPAVLAGLPGHQAIGHTRYSTAGDTAVLNAQPFSVACNKGRIAVAHNGNITNAAELRHDLECEGSIFNSSSDTEVILAAYRRWCADGDLDPLRNLARQGQPRWRATAEQMLDLFRQDEERAGAEIARLLDANNTL